MMGNVPATADWKTITKQSLPVLLGAVVIGVLSGQILVWYQDRLFAIPVLLALVPAVNGIGGNVGSILGARVASGLHIGSLWSHGGRGFGRDVTASVLLTIITFSFLGFLASAMSPLLGLESPISMAELVLTTLIAGLGLILVMILLVVVVGVLAHRYGWDPDNTIVPVLTTAGDTLGILFLLIAGGLVGL